MYTKLKESLIQKTELEMKRSVNCKPISTGMQKTRAASLSEVPVFCIPPTRGELAYHTPTRRESTHQPPTRGEAAQLTPTRSPVLLSHPCRTGRSKSVCVVNTPEPAGTTRNCRKNSVISFGETVSSWLSIPSKVRNITLTNITRLGI